MRKVWIEAALNGAWARANTLDNAQVDVPVYPSYPPISTTNIDASLSVADAAVRARTHKIGSCRLHSESDAIAA
jgi:hypothetical protein